MKRASALVLVWSCAVVLATGCSTAGDDNTDLPDGGGATTQTVQGTDANGPGQTGDLPGDPPPQAHWEVASVEQLDALMANADGYVYYYTFEELPPGLRFTRAAVGPSMRTLGMEFEGERPQTGVTLLAIPRTSMAGLTGVQEITLDGQVYYYHEDRDEETGDVYGSALLWLKDGIEFTVIPQEGVPITEDFIREYSKLRRVEFNVGKSPVGFGSGVPLIADPEKMKSVVRDNPGVEYHTGNVDPETGEDLLEP